MVKAKEFWKYLCDGLDYRVFAGVPCLGLNPLYKTMNKDMLHYMPTVNERISFGIVSGSFLAGFKGGVLLSTNFLVGLGNEIQMVKDFNISMLIIAYSNNNIKLPLWHKELSDNFEKDLDKVTNRKNPSILLIKEGVLI